MRLRRRSRPKELTSLGCWRGWATAVFLYGASLLAADPAGVSDPPGVAARPRVPAASRPVASQPAGPPEPRPPNGPGTRPHPPPRGTNQDEQVESQADFTSRRQLTHILYRDRRYQLLLDECRALLREQRPLDAFKRLSEVLQAEEDVFLWESVVRRPVSARAAARTVVRSLPPESLAAWNRFIDPAAETRLQQAIASGRLDDLFQVTASFPGTESAKTAELLGLRILFDQGRYHDAIALFADRLTTGEIASLEDADLLRLCLSLSATGRRQLAETIIARHGREWTIAGGPVESPQLLELCRTYDSSATNVDRITDWVTPQGTARGCMPLTGTPPAPFPIWSTTPAETDQPHRRLTRVADATACDDVDIQWAARQWFEECLHKDEPPISASVSLVVGELVLTRTFDAIVARDFSTGRVEWFYRCQTRLDGAPADDPPPSSAEPLDRKTVENTLASSLTCDGKNVYFVDAITLERVDDDRGRRQRLTSKVFALPLHIAAGPAVSSAIRERDERDALWVFGGEDDAPQSPPGRIPLGPPVPFAGKLYQLTESRGEISLSVLDPQTGTVEIDQTLALTDRPIESEYERRRLAFLPAIGDGRVICPTPAGAVIAWNLVEQRLDWVAQYRALDTGGRTGWKGDGTSSTCALPVQPLLSRGVAYFLPADSGRIFAFDVATGQEHWNAPRKGAFALIATGDGAVLAVEQKSVSRLCPETGVREWTTHHGNCTGRGVCLDGHYVVPLANGTLASIDMCTGDDVSTGIATASGRIPSTGRIVSDPGAASAVDDSILYRLGHLSAADGWIVSTSPAGVAAWVQAEPLRQATRRELASSVLATPRRRGIRTAVKAISQQTGKAAVPLLAAQAEVVLGRPEEALGILAGAAQTLERSPLAETARDLERTVLWQRLVASLSPTEPELTRLAELSQSPLENAQVTWLKARVAVAHRDAPAFLESFHRLAGINPPEVISVGTSHRHLVSTRVAASALLTEALEGSTPFANSNSIHAAIAREWHETRTGQQTREFLRCYDKTSWAERARAECLLEGRLQTWGSRLEQESALLRLGQSARDDVADLARLQLSRFLQPHGLAADRHSPNSSVRQVVDWSPVIGTAAVIRRANFVVAEKEPATPIASHQTVRIKVERRDDAPEEWPDLSTLLKFQREFHWHRSSELRLLKLGATDLARETRERVDASHQLAIVDHRHGAAFGHVSIPPRARISGRAVANTGHLAVLCDHAVHGVSVLDQRVIWSVRPRSQANAPVKPLVGPFGNDFCLVQTPRGIACLDPLDGQMQWERTDIPPDAGIAASSESGLFADREFLILFRGDLTTYQCLSTATGARISQGSLPEVPQSWKRRRCVFGTRLFHLTGSENEPRFQLIDLVEGEVLFEETADASLIHSEVDGAAAFLNGAGEVVVVSGTGEVLVRHPLTHTDIQGLQGIHVFRRGDRLFINTIPSEPVPNAEQTESATAEVHLEGSTVNGSLAVYDTRTGRHLWSRSFHERMFLRGPEPLSSPLITISRIRPREHIGPDPFLVEVIDADSGQTLARRTDVERFWIVLAKGDVEQGACALYGEDQRIVIDWGRPAVVAAQPSETIQR